MRIMFIVYSECVQGCSGVIRGHIHKVSIRREGYRVLRSGVTRMRRCASILEDRINIDGVDQVPGCHQSRVQSIRDQFQALGCHQ